MVYNVAPGTPFAEQSSDYTMNRPVFYPASSCKMHREISGVLH